MARGRADQAEARRRSSRSSRALSRDHEGRRAAGHPAGGRHRRQEGRSAAGAPRARPARGLQGEPGPLEDGEEGDLGGPRADRGAAAHRRARARDPRVQAGRVLDHRGAAREGRPAVHRQAASDRRQEGGDPQRGEAIASSRPRRAQDVRRHRGQAPRAPQESVGAVHDVHAAAGSGEEALVRLQAHDARGAGSLRGHRRRPEGAVGLITYMRTDSTRVAESAATQAREYLRVLFGEEFLAKGASSTATARRRTRRTRTKACVPPIPRAARRHAQVSERPTSSSSISSSGSASWRRRWRRPCSTRPRSTSTSRPRSSRRSGVAAICSAPRAASSSSRASSRCIAKRARRATRRRSRTSRRCPSIELGENSSGAGHHAVAALHRAAAALLRGEPREGARAARHRPSVDVREHHQRARRPPLREARAAPLLPHRARRDGGEGDGQAVPRHLQRGLHVGDGARARQGGRGESSAGAGCWRTSGARSTSRSRTSSSARSSPWRTTCRRS